MSLFSCRIVHNSNRILAIIALCAVNTGWNGNGERISLSNTRAIINAILDGELDDTPTRQLPIFNLNMPTSVAGIDADILDPRTSYASQSEWEAKARDLAGLFVSNFEKFTDTAAGQQLVGAGPQL